LTLLAGGDSFIWGSELADYKHCGKYGYSLSTFATLLSNNDYICTAYPGIGNVEILNRIIRNIQSNYTVLVCWTWPTRDNKIDSDSEILNLQHYLYVNRIPYMFTCVDNCIITQNPKIDYTKWFMFPPGDSSLKYKTNQPRGFYQWAIEEGYPCGADGHPLEQAHIDAAKLMQFHFLRLTS
jgi:hypothetical protein